MKLFLALPAAASQDALAACSANAGCAALPGNCCPADDGTMLACCSDLDPENEA
eukprot:CAMPEP_0204377554 /NCGR_PEP_ID=MMETSP0469-20131031/51037_1 /ASSEMBLY_ACC=CAM_ASM_000384 /TAXON_ID=2969 /ORGANISM="Oxyrrhis marina" /LENGTH=53 /DNA_ID=CAMNT_0051368657 /DNA_START=49 /DNA_END=206 /DNA_ORIENTATION=+